MELTLQLNFEKKSKRKPCKEINPIFNSYADSQSSGRPKARQYLSVCQSKLNSAATSCSISPRHSVIPLQLVSPCSVNISKQLQQKLKSRVAPAKNPVRKKSSVFLRTVNWQKENNQKIKQLQLEKEKNELHGCTFTPKLNKYIDKQRHTSLEPTRFLFANYNQRIHSSITKNFNEIIEGEQQDKVISKEDEEIELSYKRITNALDSMSKQIQDSLANSKKK